MWQFAPACRSELWTERLQRDWSFCFTLLCQILLHLLINLRSIKKKLVHFMLEGIVCYYPIWPWMMSKLEFSTIISTVALFALYFKWIIGGLPIQLVQSSLDIVPNISGFGKLKTNFSKSAYSLLLGKLLLWGLSILLICKNSKNYLSFISSTATSRERARRTKINKVPQNLSTVVPFLTI